MSAFLFFYVGWGIEPHIQYDKFSQRIWNDERVKRAKSFALARFEIDGESNPIHSDKFSQRIWNDERVKRAKSFSLARFEIDGEPNPHSFRQILAENLE